MRDTQKRRNSNKSMKSRLLMRSGRSSHVRVQYIDDDYEEDRKSTFVQKAPLISVNNADMQIKEEDEDAYAEDQDGSGSIQVMQ